MSNNDGSVERLFWMQVILRAQEEASGQYAYGGHPLRLRYNARKWLTRRNRGLIQVCEMAGFTSQMTETLMRSMQEKYRTRGSGDGR